MSGYASLVLLDTNILVHLIRGDSLGQVAYNEALASNPLERPIVSVVTVGEIKSLARRLNWGTNKRSSLDKLLRELVVADLNSAPILDRYAEIDAWAHAKGRVLSKNDLWIAATASVLRSVLITTDADFDCLDTVFLNRIRYDVTTLARV